MLLGGVWTHFCIRTRRTGGRESQLVEVGVVVVVVVVVVVEEEERTERGGQRAQVVQQREGVVGGKERDLVHTLNRGYGS